MCWITRTTKSAGIAVSPIHLAQWSLAPKNPHIIVQAWSCFLLNPFLVRSLSTERGHRPLKYRGWACSESAEFYAPGLAKTSSSSISALSDPALRSFPISFATSEQQSDQFPLATDTAKPSTPQAWTGSEAQAKANPSCEQASRCRP